VANTTTFTRVYPSAIPPMRADKAALGFMPTSAFQYCEAMRVASSHGWYLFPPVDIHLRFNGADVFHETAAGWELLSFAYLPGLIELWDEHCPAEFQGFVPPHLRALPARGVVQVWSGWLIGTAPGWSTLIRPIANVTRSHLFHCYEGLIETDQFQPMPLFVNLQISATDVPIVMRHDTPLFQVQPIQRDSYSDGAHDCQWKEAFAMSGGDAPSMSAEDWASYRKTFRSDEPSEPHRLGDYGAAVRKRAKRSTPDGGQK
jgi:hypothetical protein